MAEPLRVVHVLRAPVGGLFRHVRDLAQAQAASGMAVGIICAPPPGSASAEALEIVEHVCALGVHRIAMSRLPGPSDVSALMKIRDRCRRLGAAIVHGHGAKGGAYARLVARGIGAKAVYTPHGGSLHYARRSPAGAMFLGLERALLGRTDRLIFVCAFERDAFTAKVGKPPAASSVIHNGIGTDELEPVAPADAATDILFVGELRTLKGVDVLLAALSRLRSHRDATATIVGAGPDAETFRQEADRLGLGGRVRFAGLLPAREAFRTGRLLVVPSRAESFPYIVLEAAGARLPLIASQVGGIPEILTGRFAAMMVPPGDPDALARAIDEALDDREGRHILASQLAETVARRFSVARMAEEVARTYRVLLTPARRAGSAMLAGSSGVK